MKRTTLLLVGLLATAVPLTSAIAGPGFGGGPIPGVPGKLEFMIERMADHLDLTDDQRVSIENILQAAKPEFETLRDQAMANRDAIESLDPTDPAYDTTLQNIAISNGQLATEATLLMARVRGEAHAVLTAEQIAKLERGKARMKERRRGRFNQG